MKIVLLDFDGPIIPTRAFAIDPGGILDTPDPIAGALINDALKRAEAQLVVSSSWRRLGYPTCQEVLEKANVCTSRVHSDWATPTGPSRKNAILEWIKNHPEVETWVAIDDAKLDLPSDNYIRVTTRDGFLLEHYLKLCDLLGISPYRTGE